MKMYDRVTVLNDDESKNMTGTVVGTANYCVDDGDIRYFGGDHGTMLTTYVVRLDYTDQGWLNAVAEDGEGGTSFISHLMVEAEGLVPAPWFVNVYEEDRAYGGPEEGGWWYDVRTPVHSERFDTREEALAYGEKLNDEYPAEGERPVSSVLYSGGAHNIRIENHPPVASPQTTPHYE